MDKNDLSIEERIKAANILLTMLHIWKYQDGGKDRFPVKMIFSAGGIESKPLAIEVDHAYFKDLIGYLGHFIAGYRNSLIANGEDYKIYLGPGGPRMPFITEPQEESKKPLKGD